MKNNLETFRVLYIIKGCLLTIPSLFIIGCIGFASSLLNSNGEYHYEMQSQGELPFDPFIILKFLASIGILISVLIIGFIVSNFLTAYFLKKKKNYYFIFTISILSLFTGILGILLGVFTLIEISKPEVKALFFNPNKNTSDHAGIIQ